MRRGALSGPLTAIAPSGPLRAVWRGEGLLAPRQDRCQPYSRPDPQTGD